MDEWMDGVIVVNVGGRITRITEHFQMNTQGIGGDCNTALHWFCYSFAECERVIKRGFSGVTGYEVAGNPIVVGGN